MQFEVWAKVLKVVIIREFCKNKNQVQKKNMVLSVDSNAYN